MKKITNTKHVFEASDGEIFNDEDRCKEYENFLELKKLYSKHFKMYTLRVQYTFKKKAKDHWKVSMQENMMHLNWEWKDDEYINFWLENEKGYGVVNYEEDDDYKKYFLFGKPEKIYWYTDNDPKAHMKTVVRFLDISQKDELIKKAKAMIVDNILKRAKEIKIERTKQFEREMEDCNNIITTIESAKNPYELEQLIKITKHLILL